MSLVEPDLILFHGGRLEGAVELRTRSGSMAYGPGFYMTTSYWTAREYRGGNGRVYRVRVKTPLRWSDDVRLTVPEVEVMLAMIPKLKRRMDVIDDLREHLMRTKQDTVKGTVSMLHVLNVLGNNGSYGALLAREVARAMVEAGCDATLIRGANGGSEDWVALHNVSKIRDYEATTGPEDDRPRLTSES